MSQTKTNKTSEQEHFFTAAKTVAVITMIARIFGFFRDMGITSLGATRYNDAFGLAFKIPNLFRRLFGEGALVSAFVPVFTEVNEKGGLDKARRLLANSFGLLSVFLALLLVIGEVCFIGYYFFADKADNQFLMLLSVIMFPYSFTVCLLALCSAALNAKGHFLFPAAAPIVFNIFGIAAAWWIAPALGKDIQGQLVIVAFSVITAGVVQLGAVIWLLSKSRVFSLPFIKPVDPAIKDILKLLVPMLLGLGFLQFSEFFQDALAWILTATADKESISIFGFVLPCPLKEGVIVRINAARAFYQLPMGVLAISLGVAVFPLLSRYASRGDIVSLRKSINRAIRLSMVEGMATGVGLYILAEPIMMIYARRKFTVEDAQQAAFVLQMYVIGMWAYCTYQILSRAFYAMKDTKTPLKVSCILSVFNLAMLVVLIFIPKIQAGAFGLSTAITFSVNALILFYILHKKLGRLGGSLILKSFLKTVISCVIMALAVHYTQKAISSFNNIAVLAICIPTGAAVFIVSMISMGSLELKELFGRDKQLAN